jgi:hypothetical protein
MKEKYPREEKRKVPSPDKRSHPKVKMHIGEL